MKPSVTTRTSDSPFDIHLNHKYLHYRRTKIVATVGPASNSPQMLRKLIAGGVNVIRINFSHGNPEDHVKVMRLIRQVSAQLETSVAILADLCGPKVRVGKFTGDAVTLKEGSTVWITTDAVLGTETLIPSQYRGIVREARVGDAVLLDDGNLELKVLKKVGDRLQAKVIHGGLLKNNKSMNLPYTPMNISALTDKDRRDVTFAVRGGADYVALSFVRNPQDILDLRHCLKALKVETPIIAKIEKPEALRNIRRIVELADGIMVARGDLGVELPARKVPMIQNKLIAIANECNKPVIVATQMPESMIVHSRPTRAEVTDVAGACTGRRRCGDDVGRDRLGQVPSELVPDHGRHSARDRSLPVLRPGRALPQGRSGCEQRGGGSRHGRGAAQSRPDGAFGVRDHRVRATPRAWCRQTVRQPQFLPSRRRRASPGACTWCGACTRLWCVRGRRRRSAWRTA